MTVCGMRLFRTFSIAVLLVWGIAFGLTGAINGAVTSASAEHHVRVGDEATGHISSGVPGHVKGSSSDSDLWRDIKSGTRGTVSIPDKKAGVMINPYGEDWRLFRGESMPFWSSVLVGLALLSVIGFALAYGKIKLDGPRTERFIARFTQMERWVHWFVAGLFIMLALSGLVVLFGRTLLKPIIGAEALGTIANASLQAHNLLGPLFIIGLVLMLVIFLKDNLYQKGDFVWAFKGAFFSSDHPPSWKYNLGEKSWYWLLAFGGTAVCVSGVFLIFPNLLTDLTDMQLSHVVHAIAAVVLITASVGHIYLGVWGVEGALDSMTLGYVDETWGLEHHRWWAEEEIKKNHSVDGAPDVVLAAKKSEDS